MSRPGPVASSGSLRRPTNVTLPDALLREARHLDINLLQACERGVASVVAAVRKQRWLEQNRDAIEGYIKLRGGAPLAPDRLPAVLMARHDVHPMPVASVAAEHDAVSRALDLLIVGF